MNENVNSSPFLAFFILILRQGVTHSLLKTCEEFLFKALDLKNKNVK